MPPNENPCENEVSASQIVNIDILPAIENLVATNPSGQFLVENEGVCTGESVSLSAWPNNLGGTWSIINGNGNLNNNIYESTITDGGANVTLQFTADIIGICSNNEVSDTITFPIYALPNINTTAQINDIGNIELPNNEISICKGDNLQLNASQPNINYHLWTNSLDSSTDSTDFIISYPTTDMIYYVSYSNANTLCENSDTIYVYIETMPEISSITSECINTYTEYTVTGNYEPATALASINNNLNLNTENGTFEYTVPISIDSVAITLSTTLCDTTFYIQAPD